VSQSCLATVHRQYSPDLHRQVQALLILLEAMPALEAPSPELIALSASGALPDDQTTAAAETADHA